MNMKKILVILLAGMLLCSACGNKNPETQGNADTISGESAENSGADQTAAPDNGGQQAEEPEQSVEVKLPPVVKQETLTVQRTTEDGETVLAEVTYDSLTLSGEGYEKAADTVKQLFFHTQEEVDKAADNLAEEAGEQYRLFLEEDYFFSPYSTESQYEVVRLDTQVLSVRETGYDYMGGVHGMYGESGVTVDMVTGEKLELSHLTNDYQAFLRKATDFINADLADREEEVYEGFAGISPDDMETINWYLDADGIVFFFNPYEIGPYSSGVISVNMPYSEAEECMKPEYCRLHGAAVAKLSRDGVNSLEFKEGAGEGTIALLTRQVNENIDELVITVNGQENVIGDYLYTFHPYFLRRPEGRSFLLFDVDWASDDYVTYVYELTDGKFVLTDSVGGDFDGRCVNLESINVNTTLQVLGTRIASMEYALTKEGKLVQTAERFEFSSRSEAGLLKTLRELPVSVDGQETTLPAGTALWIVATDDAGTAWYETDSGEKGEIHYQRTEEDYALSIDGLSEYEYFENLPYAG